MLVLVNPKQARDLGSEVCTKSLTSKLACIWIIYQRILIVMSLCTLWTLSRDGDKKDVAVSASKDGNDREDQIYQQELDVCVAQARALVNVFTYGEINSASSQPTVPH